MSYHFQIRGKNMQFKKTHRTSKYRLGTSNPNPVERQAIPKIPSDDVVLTTKRGCGDLVTLGEGQYAVVYKAVLTLQGKRYHAAVKSFHPLDADVDIDEDELCLREAQFIQHLNRTGYVPKLHGIVYGCHPDLGEDLCIVQALFADGVELWSVLGDFVKLPGSIRRHVAWKLAKGLRAIHRKGVLLNDIHSRNVLVDVKSPDRPVQFIDMGLATFGPAYDVYEDELEDSQHLAPEVIREGGRVTTASDIYSLGIIIQGLNNGVNDCLMTEAADICLDTDPEERDLDQVISLLKDPRRVNSRPFRRRPKVVSTKY